LIWRACERVGIRPPDIKESWDDLPAAVTAEILAYERIRAYEDQDERGQLYEVMGAKVM